MRLQDQVIVVTGASQGLGKRMAEKFIQAGASVVLSSRNEHRLQEVTSALDNPENLTYVPANVKSEDELKQVINITMNQFGTIDVLVNNAGVKQSTISEGNEHPVDAVPIDVWKTIIDVNLHGPFLCTKVVLPIMLKRNSGRIIHISSAMGQNGRPNRSPYVASKHGLEGFHKSLAAELEDTGIESLILEPGGGVNTGFADHLSEEEKEDRLSPDVIADPAVQLAAGHGKNGGRYVATDLQNGRNGEEE